MKKIFYKFNWRLMLIQFLCSLFFAALLLQINALIHLDFLERIQVFGDFMDKYGADYINKMSEYKGPMVNDYEITNYYLWSGILIPIGLLISFIITLIFSIKNKLFWGNSVFMLLFTLSVALVRIEHYQILRIISQLPTWFIHLPIKTHILDNMLVISFVLTLVLSRTLRFINRS